MSASYGSIFARSRFSSSASKTIEYILLYTRADIFRYAKYFEGVIVYLYPRITQIVFHHECEEINRAFIKKNEFP